MTTKDHPLLGKWRITDLKPWDAEFIDLLGPGSIQFDPDGGGEFAFGAVQEDSMATSAPTASTSTARPVTTSTTPAAMAMPTSKRMAPSPVKSASIAATSQPSQRDAGSFSAAC
jgi:hypothetical protein